MADVTTAFDDAVRPTKWDDYVGQERMKGRLEVVIDAAIADERELDHILLVAPPGTGKTTLASLIAAKYFAEFKALTMPIKIEPFLDIVEEFEGVLFLDEIHNAPKSFQEMLQPALEEGVLRTTYGFSIDVSRIVFVGATVTEYRPKILEPLQQRFEVQPKWEPYTDAEIATILSGMADRLGFPLDREVCDGLAGACGATPRLARRMVKAARDLRAVGRSVTAASVLDHVGVDADGLGPEHLDYLRMIRAQGGTAGLRNLANLMSMSAGAVEDLERILATKGFVHLSPSGRRLTASGRAKIGVGRQSRASA